MIELEQIDKYYHRGTSNEIQLFDHFSLNVETGEFVTIIGSNGSGKTSLLNLISGATSIDGGKIFIENRDNLNRKEFRRYQQMGRVFQDPSLGTAPSMTILENLSMADNKNKPWNLARGINYGRQKEYQNRLARLGLGLEDKLNTPVGLLSGGQRQALALVMVSLTPIRILLLDEHTASLDPQTADKIMQYTDVLVREKKLTTLMVTHNLKYSMDYGDRLLMMHRGKVILDCDANAKDKLKLNDILDHFNQISLESGHSI